MNKEDVITYVEKIINNESDVDWTLFEDDSMTSVESFLVNNAIRLIKIYQKYDLGEAGESDYLASLRNFMLTFRCPLRIENASLLKKNHFGIYQNDEYGFSYSAFQETPNYIAHKEFVNDAFITDQYIYPKKSEIYLLQTNSFVNGLTGYNTFKSIDQKLSVYGALKTPRGYTTLISMSTGGGKSLVTQTVAYSEGGLTVVIVPTVSLAIDQERVAKKNIKTHNEDEIFSYYGGMSKGKSKRLYDALDEKKVKLLFISPEALLKNEQFKELIENSSKSKYLKNIIIDEAHIVIAWGDLFRVDYQCLEPWRNHLMTFNPDIRTFLLSATFEDRTVSNLKKMFSTNNRWIEIRCDSLRREPRYCLIKTKPQLKEKNVLELVNKLPHPMIIYVSSPHDARRWKDFLSRYGYMNIRMFTGETKSDDRERIIQEWTRNEFDIMLATSAFGVGVDKPDVRTVLHLYVPETPDAYYQELGRGGRDGLPSLSVMCISPNADIDRAFNHITKVLTTDKFFTRWRTMLRNKYNVWVDGKISMDATVKPLYLEEERYQKGNAAHVKWNMNVLLMLRRYDMLEITSLEQTGINDYTVEVKVIDERLLDRNETTKQLFEEIRNKEYEYSLKQFDLMKTAISQSDKYCWSNMFYDTYPLVTEFCAGCNSHDDIQMDHTISFPLLQSITVPEENMSEKCLSVFGRTKEALIYMNSNITISELLAGIEPLNPMGIITNKKVIFYNNAFERKSTFYIMNFREFQELSDNDNEYYVSGLFVVLYDEEQPIDKQFRMINKWLSKSRNHFAIHIAQENYELSKYGKKLDELIDGVVLDANRMVKGEF